MSLVFERFSFEALWSPYYFVAILCVTVLYLLAISVWQAKFDGSYKVPRWKVFNFVFGMLLIYMMEGGPVDLFSHLMFTAHMVQMAVLYLLVPPILLTGTPDWLMKAILGKWKIAQVIRLFSKPLLALILFNGIFSFYHVPFIFDYVKSNGYLHAIYTGVLFFFALMMWWPIFCPIKEMHTLSSLKKIAYIFANGIIITPACALIIFSSQPMYTIYTDPKTWIQALQLCVPADQINTLKGIGPETFNFLPALEDQQLGGIIMKMLQEIIYSTVLFYIFAQWIRHERNQDNNNLNDLLSPQSIDV